MKKLLMIEDNKDFAELTKAALTLLNGYDVTVFHTAHEGLAHAKTNKPDLIIMDIMLPKMDGPEAAELIQKEATLKNVPILFLTGLVSSREKELQNQGIVIQGKSYKVLAKPFEIPVLVQIIEGMLREKTIETKKNV